MRKNRKKASPPRDMTIAQASEFWDEHSLFEFDGTEEVDVKFKLKKKRYVGIDLQMFEKVKRRASRQKISPDALIESWIAEKVG